MLLQTKVKRKELPKDPARIEESCVDLGSYIDAHRQIESMMLSGKRLIMTRQGYDDKDGQADDIRPDVRRKLYYEKLEANGLINSLEEKARLTKARMDKKAGTPVQAETVTEKEKRLPDDLQSKDMDK